MKRKHTPGCPCCEIPDPCDCDPSPEGVTLTFSGGDIPDGFYTVDVARPPGAISMPFDVTFPLDIVIDMSDSGQASVRNRVYNTGFYGPILVSSVTTHTAWNKVFHLDRSLRIWGNVQFPPQPNCITRISYTVELRHDGYITRYRGGSMWGSDAGSGDWGEVVELNQACRLFPSQGGPPAIFETEKTCDWSLDPDVLTNCDIGGGEFDLMDPKVIAERRIQGGGSLTWNECPVEDPKEAIVHINELWTGDNFVNYIPGRQGLFVLNSGLIGHCVVDQPYIADHSFDLTIGAEFYA